MAIDPNNTGAGGKDPFEKFLKDQADPSNNKLLIELKRFLKEDFPGHMARNAGGGGGGGGGDSESGGGNTKSASEGLQEARRVNRLIGTQSAFVGALGSGASELKRHQRELSNLRREDFASQALYDERREELEELVTNTLIDFEDNLASSVRSISDFGEFLSGATDLGMDNFLTALANVRQSLQNFAAELVDLSYTTERAKHAWEQMFELANRNIGTMGDYFSSLGQTAAALDVLTAGIDRNASSFSFFDGSFRDWSRTQWTQFQRLNAMGDLGESLTGMQMVQLLDTINVRLARQGNADMINTREAVQYANRMGEIYQQIAANTGMTVEAVMNLAEQANITNDAMMRGLNISDEQRNALLALEPMISQFGEYGLDQEMYQAIISSMRIGPAAFEGMDFARMQLGIMLSEMIRSGVQPTMEDVAEIMQRLGTATQGIPIQEIALSSGRFLAGAETITDRLADHDNQLAQHFNHFMEGVRIFGNLVKDGFGVIGGAAWLFVVGQHWLAMRAHTAALTGAAATSGMGLLGGARSVFTSGPIGTAGVASAGSVIAGLGFVMSVAALLGIIAYSFGDAFTPPRPEELESMSDGVSDLGVRLGAFVSDIIPGVIAAVGLVVGGILAFTVGIPAALVATIGTVIFLFLNYITGNALGDWLGRGARDAWRDFVALGQGNIGDIFQQILAWIWNWTIEAAEAFVNFPTNVGNMVRRWLGWEEQETMSFDRWHAGPGVVAHGINAPELELSEEEHNLLARGGATRDDGYTDAEVRRAIDQLRESSDEMNQRQLAVFEQMLRTLGRQGYSSN